MDRTRQVLGKTISCSATEALLLAEAAICEGVSLPHHWPAPAVEHLFGRSAKFQRGQGLSYLAGIAGGGLRAVALLPAADLSGHLPALREMVRNRIPGLIICLTDWSTQGRAPLAALKETGCFILSAATVQDAVRLALLGHLAAEQSLTPGVLLVELTGDAAEKRDIEFPEARAIREFLGDADDSIPCATPSQQMVFGKQRRRIPNWTHFDHPTLNGMGKAGLSAALETAANARYFDPVLPAILEQCFAQYCAQIPGAADAVDTNQTKDDDTLLITSGSAYPAAVAGAARMRIHSGIKAGCVHLNQVHPFPEERLMKLIGGKKTVTWLDPGCLQHSLLPDGFSSRITAAYGKNVPKWLHGTIIVRPTPEILTAVFQNMADKSAAKTDFIAGVQFNRNGSAYPQHEILLQNIGRQFPEAQHWGLSSETEHKTPERSNQTGALPISVRRHKDLGPPYTRVNRFHHDVISLYTDGAFHELVADPFQALPVAPAGTAGLAGGPAERSLLPRFTPEHCTGCGECLVYCPHAALPAVALNVEQLLRGAMEMAGKAGAPLTQLTPVLKNLGKIAGQVILEATAPVQKVADFLPEAFTRLSAQMHWEAEKWEKISREMEKVHELLAPLPVAVTTTFFSEPERQDKGSGDLFILALDAQACTGCGVCATVCAPGALEMVPETPTLLDLAAATLECWEQLPDTAPATLQRRYNDTAYNPLAAVMLSRYNYGSLSGPGNDTSAPAKAMLHLFTAVTESVEQPKMAARYREIGQLTEALAENIRRILGEALPAEGSQALAEAMTEAGGRKLPLEEVMAKLATHEHQKLVDTAVLKRKIELLNELQQLLWTLKEGPSGGGRARYGLFFPGETAVEADVYPFNPFQAPALLASSGTLETATGWFEAHTRHTIDNIRLLRRARLEAKNQYRPEVHDVEIAGLGWEDLDETEKSLIAPLLVVCRLEQLPENFFGQLPEILTGHYPLKIMVLDNGAFTPWESAEIRLGARNTLLQLAQNARQVPVFMGSAAEPPVLYDGVLRAVQSPGPALCVVLAPEPARHIRPARQWPALHQLALDSRMMPYYRFNPEAPGLTRASRISLKGNPAEDREWADAPGSNNTVLTFAAWLFSLSAWQGHFQEWTNHEAPASPLHEYLKSGVEEREGKSPVYQQPDENGSVATYIVSPQVVRACEAALAAWNDLREMAGALSAHPQKLWEAAEAEVSARYEAQLREVEAAYERRIQRLERDFIEKTRVQLREKLLTLAKNRG